MFEGISACPALVYVPASYAFQRTIALHSSHAGGAGNRGYTRQTIWAQESEYGKLTRWIPGENDRDSLVQGKDSPFVLLG
ncbi:hypothetical protein SAMD00023353_9200230 [Rosellinia necatrix]|uniref:Uncharacterized protein n=1 Tax=Rosellinia necatrix TaxID=77044 RepID=A0A1S8AAY5_ROSNE|nr:hypothetical protein SAMD00023353_9200230 [Rosellinia necatrix]